MAPIVEYGEDPYGRSNEFRVERNSRFPRDVLVDSPYIFTDSKEADSFNKDVVSIARSLEEQGFKVVIERSVRNPFKGEKFEKFLIVKNGWPDEVVTAISNEERARVNNTPLSTACLPFHGEDLLIIDCPASSVVGANNTILLTHAAQRARQGDTNFLATDEVGTKLFEVLNASGLNPSMVGRGVIQIDDLMTGNGVESVLGAHETRWAAEEARLNSRMGRAREQVHEQLMHARRQVVTQMAEYSGYDPPSSPVGFQPQINSEVYTPNSPEFTRISIGRGGLIFEFKDKGPLTPDQVVDRMRAIATGLGAGSGGVHMAQGMGTVTCEDKGNPQFFQEVINWAEAQGFIDDVTAGDLRMDAAQRRGQGPTPRGGKRIPPRP